MTRHVKPAAWKRSELKPKNGTKSDRRNKMGNNQLIPYQEVEQFGKAMVASGFFKDVSQISQAIVKIQAGAELGLPPFASMTGIHIINGKPVLGANILATLIKNDPRYDYRVIKLDDTICTIKFFEGREEVGVSTFTIEDAKKAGTQNTQKFPRNMLFARSMSNGAKWYCPGIFGGAPIYTPEDFGLEVDEDGAIIEGSYATVEPTAVTKPEPQPQPQKPAAKQSAGQKPTIAMLNKLHAIGTQKFGDSWDDARHELIGTLTNGRTQSSKELSYEECVKLAETIKSFADYQDGDTIDLFNEEE
jgi:hypothetical protein